MPKLTPVKPLVFLRCGGTFEKTYSATEGALNFEGANLERWIRPCRIAPKPRIETVMLIDSLEMNDSHRQQLADAIASAAENQIVVIHGTDTMTKSALYITPTKRVEQVVVFTGAMVPAALCDSDASFNLGLATAAAQLLPPGVYVAMSGQIFEASRTQKNPVLQQFEHLSSDD
jgi:L-asparaginase